MCFSLSHYRKAFAELQEGAEFRHFVAFRAHDAAQASGIARALLAG
jgi:hypothetical protein